MAITAAAAGIERRKGAMRCTGMMGSYIIRGGSADVDATFEGGYRSQAAIDAIMRASVSRSWERVATCLHSASE